MNMAMITRLPNELLLRINDFLDDEDLITLSATCRKFHSSTEEARKFANSAHHAECRYMWPRVWTRKFLVLTDLDTLDSTKQLCCRCSRWHDIKALRDRGAGTTSEKVCCSGRTWAPADHPKLFTPQPWQCADKSLQMITGDSSSFPTQSHLWCLPRRAGHIIQGPRGPKHLDWHVIQLVMRAERLGPYFGIMLPCLENYVSSLDSEGGRRITAKAVVVEDHLLMKISCVWSGVVTDCSPHCVHLCSQRTGSNNDNPLSKLLQCMAGHIREGTDHATCDECSRVYECPRCPTEYAVEAFNMGGRWKEWQICLSTWTDFGSGVSPWTTQWLALTSGTYHEPIKALEARGQDEGSIKACFENALNLKESTKAAGKEEISLRLDTMEESRFKARDRPCETCGRHDHLPFCINHDTGSRLGADSQRIASCYDSNWLSQCCRTSPDSTAAPDCERPRKRLSRGLGGLHSVSA